MTVYYVDPAGSDAANGTSTGTAWATIGKANAASLNPGDSLLLKRGGTWTGTTLQITGSGASGNPILVGAYGTGALPIIDGGGTDTTRGTVDCVLLDGSWIVVENLQAQHALSQGFACAGNDLELRNFLATHNPVGVNVYPGSARHKIHDFVCADNNIEMVGPGDNDDNGAMGMSLSGDSTEVWAFVISGSLSLASPDYGSDGSAIEIYGATNTLIRDGVARECETFTEMGANTTNNVVFRNIAYSSSFSDALGVVVQGDPPFGPVTGVTITNCTIQLTGAYSQGFITTGTAVCTFVNNIVQAAKLGFTGQPQPERNNLYFGASNGSQIESTYHPTQSGIAPSSTVADPLWVNPTGGADLRLRPGSPAINRGLPVTFLTDLDGRPRTVGSAPDAGAYERQEATTVAPRLLGPDVARRAINANIGGKALDFAGKVATVYLDAAATALAPIAAYDSSTPTIPGATIANSQVTLTANSRLPLFWFPPGVDTLHVVIAGLSHVWTITADVDARLDAMTAALYAGPSVKTDRNMVLRGVNLAGAEFGSWNNANANPANWRWPLEQEYAYLAGRGHKLVRLPYLWERIQPDLTLPCDPAMLAELDKQVAFATKYGMKLILDLHNYGGYKSVKFGAVGGPTEQQFAAHWAEIATRYRYDPTVIGLGLMNEPGSMPTSDIGDGRGNQTGQFRWYAFAQTAVNAIRATGDTTAIMVSGYAAGVVNSWLSNSAGVGNKEIHRYVTDPLDNLFFEGHIYWDGSGSYPNSYASYNTSSGQTDSPATDGLTKVQLTQLHAWLDWAQENNVRVYLGEVGWPRITGATDATSSAAWNALAEEYYRLLDAYGIWATYWAAGSKWTSGYNLKAYLSDSGNPDILASPAENAAPIEAHPSFRAQYVPRGRRPLTAVRMNLQWRGQNVPVETCSGSSAMVNGQEYGTTIAIDVPGSLSRLTVYVGTAGAGNTAGQCFAAFYDATTGVELCRSADFGTKLNATGYQTIDMLPPRTQTFREGELVAAKILWNGTTPPQLLKAPLPVAAANSRRFGVVSTGATTLSNTLAINSMTAATQPFWVAAAGY